MRVVIVSGIFPPDIGGPATHAAQLRDELSAKGHSVTVLSLTDGPREHAEGIVRFPRRWPWAARLVAVVWWLWRRRTTYDVAYATGLHAAAVAGARLARRPVAVKVVGDPVWERARRRGLTELSFDEFQRVRYSGLRTIMMRRARNWWLRHASAVTTPSRYLAEQVESWLGGPAGLEVIPNAAKCPLHTRRSPRVRRTLRAVFVGRLVRHKRLELLIEALRSLPGVRLRIVGDGPERERLDRLATETGVADRVEFLGQVERQQVAAHLSESDVLVLASEYEGLPFVAVEALTAGIAVVSVKTGGVTEIVTHGENGLLVEPTHTGLVAALSSLARDDALLIRLSDGARRRAHDYRLGDCVARIERLLCAVIVGKPRIVNLGKTSFGRRPHNELRAKIDLLIRHWDLRVVALGGIGPARCGRTRLHLFPTLWPPMLGGLAFYLLAPFVALSLAIARRGSTIVCQSPFEGFVTAFLLRPLPRRLRPRLVIEVHGDWRTTPRLYGAHSRLALARVSDRVAAFSVRRADRVRVVSSDLADLVRATGYRGPIHRYATFSDFARFSRMPPAPLPTDPSIVFVGVLQPYKGVDVLLDAWAVARQRIPKARLLLVGEGPGKDALQKRVAQLGLSGSVSFLGSIDKERLIRVLDDSWLLVLPSRSEGLPRVILESFARGRPVVATRVGGIPELIHPGRNGVLVEAEDRESLADALAEMLEHPDRVQAMASGARRTFESRDPVDEFESGVRGIAEWAMS